MHKGKSFEIYRYCNTRKDVHAKNAKAANVSQELNPSNVVVARAQEFKILGKVCLLWKSHVGHVAELAQRSNITVDLAMAVAYKRKKLDNKLAFLEE